MPPITKVEHEKRLRQVQEWLIDDWPSCDIIAQCVQKWALSERQAKRYIKSANETWVEVESEKLNAKRSRRINSLKKIKRSLKGDYIGTPAGMRALLQIEKELIRLEGVAPTKQMIESEIAKDAGKQADPLDPTESKLVIEALMPYGNTQTVNTANTKPSS